MIKGEKEIAGIYVTHNPLEKFSSEITKVSNTTILAIQNKEFKGEVIKLGGVVTEFTRRTSQERRRLRRDLFRGPERPHQGAVLQGPLGDAGKGAEGRRALFPGGRSRSRRHGEEANIYLENLQELEAMLKKKARKIVITIGYDQIDETFNDKLKQKLEKNRDSVPYMIVINHADSARVVINSEAGQGDQRHRLDEEGHRETDRARIPSRSFSRP